LSSQLAEKYHNAESTTNFYQRDEPKSRACSELRSKPQVYSI